MKFYDLKFNGTAQSFFFFASTENYHFHDTIIKKVFYALFMPTCHKSKGGEKQAPKT